MFIKNALQKSNSIEKFMCRNSPMKYPMKSRFTESVFKRQSSTQVLFTSNRSYSKKYFQNFLDIFLKTFWRSSKKHNSAKVKNLQFFFLEKVFVLNVGLVVTRGRWHFVRPLNAAFLYAYFGLFLKTYALDFFGFHLWFFKTFSIHSTSFLTFSIFSFGLFF